MTWIYVISFFCMAGISFLLCFILNEAGKNSRAHVLAENVSSWFNGDEFSVHRIGLSHFQIIVKFKFNIIPDFQRLNSKELDCLNYCKFDSSYHKTFRLKEYWPYPIFITYSGDILKYCDYQDYHPEGVNLDRIIHEYSMFTPSNEEEKEFMFHSLNLSSMTILNAFNETTQKQYFCTFNYPNASTFEKKSMNAYLFIDI